MARNQRPELKNKHHQIIGTSGSGKSSWLKQHPEIKSALLTVLWDPDEDHRSIHCRSRAEFVRTLKAALLVGKKARVAYSCQYPTEDEFMWWCDIVWSILDGKRPTVGIVEEVADVTKSGQALGPWGQLLRKGRKYNLQLFVVAQRFQECDKTTKSQCPNKWVGVLENPADRDHASKAIGVPMVDLEKMDNTNPKRLPFYFKERGPAPGVFGEFNATQ